MIGLNNAYLEELYFQFLRDPDSVSAEWRRYFEEHRQEITEQIADERGDDVGQATESLASTMPESAGPAAPQPAADRADTSLGKTNGFSAPDSAPPGAAGSESRDNGKAEQATPAPTGAVADNDISVYVGPDDEVKALSGITERIADNMDTSLSIPTATSLRTIPIIVLDENRRMINHILVRDGRSKLSFTHFIAWAIVKALKKYPGMNHAYARSQGKAQRVSRTTINLGLAVDVARRDGTRTLLVPNVKDAGSLTFLEFIEAYHAIVAKARSGKIDPDDLMGTTLTLTNPGGIGTVASMPRLMQGQGLILATGAIDYPSEFQAVAPSLKSSLAVSKVMTITSTYDHRIIQGAESGEFLQYLSRLLLGEDHFYDQIYASFNIPFEPARWSVDNSTHRFGLLDEQEVVEKESKVLQLINAYRVRGHLYANVNPLGLEYYYYPELELSYHGFTVWDFERSYDTGEFCGKKRGKLRDIITSLRDTYCRKIGLEFMHIQEPRKKTWIRDKFETEYCQLSYSRETKLKVFRKLVQAETFESYLGTKFLGQKRFSLEGAEAVLAMLEHIVATAAEQDADEIYVGMAHRGRLNVLVNILGKSAEKVFREFAGEMDPDSFHGSGDVKYHLGAEGFAATADGRKIKITLASNPSHLESVNPVVEGMARARIEELGDKEFRRVVPLLIHGDSAFAGQGVVAETLNLANLKGYRTGGTIHIIINNQIGFTTRPDEARSTVYATDIAKMLQVPILHVNGDDPEAVLTAAAFAVDYRSEFNEDVVIDMFCYRKYGHNETDEPGYTQPLLYKKIRSLRPWSEHYSKRLLREGVLTAEESKSVYDQAKAELDRAFAAREQPNEVSEASGSRQRPDPFAAVYTAVGDETITKVIRSTTEVPADFQIHRKLVDMLRKRRDSVSKDSGIDWGTGEALAYGSLLLEGYPVRLSGQDSARGTFSHRHAVLVDQRDERELFLLNAIDPGRQAEFRVYDSSLSELAVVGFEYGYAVAQRKGLVMWEAQFGDFVNGAQILFDQFLSSSEEKWGQTCNLVILLPHGYEGQGPEHSSARLERFLQLCGEDNMIVANYTTPANYFHALRRQVLRDYHKPLIIMTPKQNLRRPISKAADFTEGGYQEIIDDAEIKNPAQVRRLNFCTGKVYFELAQERAKRGVEDVALIRIEQLYPFHGARIKELLQKYRSAVELCWVQEEPRNMGAWMFVQSRLLDLLPPDQRIRYIGRPESASTATGHAVIHNREQAGIIDKALS